MTFFLQLDFLVVAEVRYYDKTLAVQLFFFHEKYASSLCFNFFTCKKYIVIKCTGVGRGAIPKLLLCAFSKIF